MRRWLEAVAAVNEWEKKQVQLVGVRPKGPAWPLRWGAKRVKVLERGNVPISNVDKRGWP